jgi:hypothetical protein
MIKRLPEIGFSAAAIACIIIHMFIPDDKLRIDSTTLVLLIISAIPWLVPFLKSLTLPGGTVLEFKDKLEQVEKKVELIEDRGLLPGRSAPNVHRSMSNDGRTSSSGKHEWATDPNKGKFGGSSRANGRILEASLKPAVGPDGAACVVRFRVRSTTKSRPLEGQVTFYLHPTFGRWSEYEVLVVNGIAKDKITSWGAFTIGAVADDGATRLELDLATVGGGTPKFYAS